MWFLVPACSPWGGTVRGQGGEDRPSILRGTWDLGPFLKGGRKMGPWAEIQGPGMFLEDWGGGGAWTLLRARSSGTTCLPYDLTCCKSWRFVFSLPPVSVRTSQPLGTQTPAFSPQAGLGSGLRSSEAITCRHEEDAGTQDDVVSSLVELTGCDAESAHEKQNHAQDRENARGPDGPCGTRAVRERENGTAVSHGGESGPWSGGFVDTGPRSSLLREGGREEEQASAHLLALQGAPVCLQDQMPVPHEAHRALCDLASAHLQPHASGLHSWSPCPLWSSHSKLPMSCHCMLLTFDILTVLLEVLFLLFLTQQTSIHP